MKDMPIGLNTEYIHSKPEFFGKGSSGWYAFVQMQRVIQILKSHHACRSKDNPDSKPIFMIITTWAARACNGETVFFAALETMYGLVNPTRPRIPHHVEPEKDFANRWYS